MTFPYVILLLVSSLLLISSILVISAENPVHAVLYLIVVFINATLLLMFLQAEFISLILLVVYVGAIAVLFLFVVMMLNIKTQEHIDVVKILPIGLIVLITFSLETVLVIAREYGNTGIGTSQLFVPSEYIEWSKYLDGIANMDLMGQIIYTHYLYFFLMSGMILLVAMIGAITLTMSNRAFKRQHIYQQVARNNGVATFMLHNRRSFIQ